jgi:hypothetical protein
MFRFQAQKMLRFQTQTARDASGTGIRGGLRRSPTWVINRPDLREMRFRGVIGNGHHSARPASLVRAKTGSRYLDFERRFAGGGKWLRLGNCFVPETASSWIAAASGVGN